MPASSPAASSAVTQLLRPSLDRGRWAGEPLRQGAAGGRLQAHLIETRRSALAALRKA